MLTACADSPHSSNAGLSHAASIDNAHSANTRTVLHIYTSIEPALIRPLLQTFAKQHDIHIRVVYAAPTQLVVALQNQPADVVISEDTAILQRAVDAALLQPFSAGQVINDVPEPYLNPEGEWLALSYHARTAVYDSRVLTAADVGSFASLAAPKWAQKLCLTGAQDPANQALVAQLIQDMGETKARALLQGWLANLARPPFDDNDALLAAIARGECQIGLVDSQRFARFAEKHPNTPLKLAWVNASAGGVPKRLSAVAMARASSQPEIALQFIEWLAAPDQQSLFASLTDTYPIHPQAQASVRLQALGEGTFSKITLAQTQAGLANAKMLMNDVGYR